MARQLVRILFHRHPAVAVLRDAREVALRRREAEPERDSLLHRPRPDVDVLEADAFAAVIRGRRAPEQPAHFDLLLHPLLASLKPDAPASPLPLLPTTPH